jgi:hypothetical protein
MRAIHLALVIFQRRQIARYVTSVHHSLVMLREISEFQEM